MDNLNLLKIASDSAANYYQTPEVTPTSTTYAKPAGTLSGLAGLIAGNKEATKFKLKGKAGVVTRLGTGLFWGGLGSLGGSFVKREGN